MEVKDTKDNKKKIITISITDFHGSANLKIIDTNERCSPILELKKGMSILARGDAQYDNFDQCDVVRLLYNSQPQFETWAKEFRLIDDKTYPVIINYEKSQVLVESLRSNGPSYRLMRQLAQYSVNVRQRELQQLMQMGAIEEILEGVYYASNQAFYSKEVGLVFDNIWIEENYII